MVSQIRWRVKNKAPQHATACAPELVSMLACFASTGDMRAQGEGSAGCATAMRNLHACMKKQGPRPKIQKSSINYLLSKVK